MNIEFKILWIDDDNDFTEELMDELKFNVESLNVIPDIKCFKQFTNEQASRVGNKYDLILVDYNLSNEKVGTEIISRIRSNFMLPDIVFYSSVSSIDEIIKKENDAGRESIISILQKGIYFCSSDELTTISKKVVKKIVSRDEKINGFRGIVLSFVAEYESVVNEVIKIGLSKISDKTNLNKYIESRVLDEIQKEASKKLNRFRLNENPDKSFEIVNDQNHTLDHSKKVRIMNEILRQVGKSEFDINNYQENILKLRNSLGHIKYEQNCDEEYYSFYLDGNITYLTSEYCSEKRKELLTWKNELDIILDSLISN